VANAFVFCQKPASLFAAAETECAANILVCSQEPAGLFIRDGGRVCGESPCLLPKTCQPVRRCSDRVCGEYPCLFARICRPVYLWQRRGSVVSLLVFCQKPASLFAAAATECAVNILVCSQEPAGLFIRDGGRVRGESPCLLPKTCQPASQHNNTKYATLRYNFIPNPPEQDAMTI
jgi:hypothetical protein